MSFTALANPTGWGEIRRRRRPQYALDYTYEIRFPGWRSDVATQHIEQIQRSVKCMVKRDRLMPRFDIDSFNIYVRTQDELFAVRMATNITDVSIFQFYAPVPRGKGLR